LLPNASKAFNRKGREESQAKFAKERSALRKFWLILSATFADFICVLCEELLSASSAAFSYVWANCVF